jgi:hypothetical protein
MAQSSPLREQAARCGRLARDNTDLGLRDGLFRLAEEYSARADCQETGDAAGSPAGANDDEDAT